MTHTSTVYVITGASRGIGLEKVRQLSKQEGAIVYAGARNPEGSKELMALVDNKKVIAFTIDINSRESIDKGAAKVAETATEGIDYLINNAGVNGGAQANVLEATKEELVNLFTTNVAGVSDVTQAFVPLLRKRGSDKVKKIVNLSTGLGSTSAFLSGPYFEPLSSYRVSKTALNMLTELQAEKLGPENFAVVALSPGWVKTEMGGPGAQLEVADAVQDILKTINNIKATDNGRFLNYDGDVLAW